MPNPRKPSALKRLQGTHRADRANPDEPQPTVEAPDPPSFLGEVELDKWHQMVELLSSMDVLTEADGDALGQYCVAWGQYVRATETLASEGELMPVKSARGVVQRYMKHPAVAIQNEASGRLEKLGARFGLTPSDRAGLKTNTPRASKDDDFLDRKRERGKSPDLRVAR